MPRQKGLSIGSLAKLSQVNLETVRYYERIGLMPAPDRTEGGHRVYEPAHQRRLAFIRRARELGFGIGGIRTLLGLAEPHRRSCDEVRVIASDHLRDVRAKIEDLLRLEAILAGTVERCDSRTAVPSCPVLDLLEAKSQPGSS